MSHGYFPLMHEMHTGSEIWSSLGSSDYIQMSHGYSPLMHKMHTGSEIAAIIACRRTKVDTAYENFKGFMKFPNKKNDHS